MHGELGSAMCSHEKGAMRVPSGSGQRLEQAGRVAAVAAWGKSYGQVGGKLWVVMLACCIGKEARREVAWRNGRLGDHLASTFV